ncbi:MAG: hypothetical protein HLX47_12930 [Staphylococcus sp.]|uniref:hypothetical protein n=1 Tax=Staphylococcus sp. TaxID=29387 RepID=UPI0017E015D5|nr:hypothetical protein [Staphylococcus sp.]NWN86774.1 hypothetical protein [Staphylococcus sp.]
MVKRNEIDIISIFASMQIYRSMSVPGILILFKDRIQFQAKGVLEGKEMKDTFYLNNIKGIKRTYLPLLSRLVITENDGEVWEFHQVNRADAKQFISLYGDVKSFSEN